jgi:hypothetical protein
MAAGNASFAIALPPDWKGIDLLSGEAEHVIEPPLAAALAAAARGSEHARLLMVRSLVTVTPEGEPLAAGLSVALADTSAPISHTSLSALSLEDADVSAVTLPAGSGVRLRRVAPAEVLAGVGPLEVLRIQYMLHTELGLLTITFTTPQATRTREWERLFDAMADTARLA